ncbi:hypothetical protein BKA67DRAFT_585069 [Truncatella angustata]|uniref:Cyclochlorotine biosynthesis protein O n=1 Tax=Truncatella angustata TaxID=152316 RepID=A0A9P8RLH2_9PEZI|nr:uncharacterized protein BKA67DRAFT_585069 [Truncatella angustata]KAH6645445.1 hypothetical protein BKA67DRAFT_585069 [Truncatella angustata]
MEKYSEDSLDHLLKRNCEYSDDGAGLDISHSQPRQPWRAWLRKNVLSIFISTMLLYIAAVLTVQLNFKSSHQKPEDFLLVRDEYHPLPGLDIKFEKRIEWTEHREHPWNLEPSDELDAAWDDLLYALNIRISPQEMGAMNETTHNRVRVTGGGYAGAMGIWHELHCLNNFRKLIHWDYYGPKYGGTENPEAFGKEHSDHCLDMVRQSLMCRPDTSIYPFHWGADGIPSNHVKAQNPTTCVKWDSLDGWASDRALRPGEYSYLRDHKPERAA